MLKRIKKIQNIGRFKSCNGGEAEFDKITFLFGRNTYGKTTLSDVLASIGTGNTDAIKTRKTLPIDPANPNQIAELKFLAEGAQSEVAVRLNGGRWEPAMPGGLRLHVFDDGFYHNNLFSGRQFTRDTKVNFSAFILGERGVGKAKEIADKNKQKADATRDRGKLLKAALSDIEGLPQFLSLVPEESADELEGKVLALRREYEILAKQHKNIEKIRTRKSLDELGWEPGVSAALSTLNQTLSKSLDAHHGEARKAIAKHIESTFTNVENAESWIRHGLSQNDGINCQFCGQMLSDDALRLLDIYRKSFDSSFHEHERHVAQALAANAAILSEDRVNAQRLTIESNAGITYSYPELEEDVRFQDTKRALDEHAAELEELLAQWGSAQKVLHEQIEIARQKKLASPQASVPPVDGEQLSVIDHKLSIEISEYNTIAKQINALFDDFKESLLDEPLNKRLQELAMQGKAEARKWERVKRSAQCDDYINYTRLIKNLSAEIPVLQMSLVNEQSDYLDQFFERVNRFFVMFGSRNFQLEKGKDDTGHMPIYYLKVKLNKVVVPERDLVCIFSESDRRALALAVFWSGVDGLDAVEKSRAIVVLDDPITSFDTGRMTAVHQAIVEMADSVQQIIVFSHFQQGTCQFLNTYRKNKPVKLLQIAFEGESSRIVAPDVERFMYSEHERKRADILRFISGEINQHSAGDLRVFLEVEISYRFAKQLINVQEENLSDRIDQLYENGAISEKTTKAAHAWREILNPSHHTWTESDIEDQRNTASQFIDFVYHQLVPVEIAVMS